MASLARRLWKWFAGLFAGLAILSALLIGAFRVAADQLPEYRTPIEEWASGVLGLPVEIGGMDARLGFDGPEILLRDAAILSAADGSVLLRADTASLSLDVSELLFGWRVTGDRFTIDGAELDILRDTSGELFILGVPVSSIKPRGQAVLADIRLRGGRVVFKDEMEGGGRWVFRDADVNLSGSAKALRVDLSLVPPGELARRVSGWTEATVNDVGAYSDWRISLWFEALDFSSLHRLAGLKALPRLAGEADLRLWLDLQGTSVTRVSAETVIEGLAMAEAMTSPGGAGYQLIDGRFDWDRVRSGWRLKATDLTVRRGGRDWRNASIELRSGMDEAGTRSWGMAAERIRLEDLTPLAPLLPDEALRETLFSLNPRGDLEQVEIAVETTAGDTPERRIEMDLLLDRVSIDPWQKIPGVTGLVGRLRSDRRGGRLELDMGTSAVDFPRLFRAPLDLTRLNGLVVWSEGSDGITIIGDELGAASADLDLQVGFRLRLPVGDQPGAIDLDARMSEVDLANASPYMPAGIMSPRVLGWLDRGLVSGTARDVEAVIRGPLKGFPYRDDEGVFRITFDVDDMTLDYANGWTRGESIQAVMEFENEGLNATLESAQMAGLTLNDIQVSIPDLPAGQLTVRGPARGEFRDLQRFLLDSPIAPRLGEGFAKLRIEQGQAEARVDMLLPLRDLPATRVNVDVAVSDAVLGYGYIPHTLESVNGTLQMQGPKFSGQGLRATLFDEPVNIDVVPRDNGSTRAIASGRISAQRLLDPVSVPLAQHLQGTSDWQAYVHFPGPGPDDAFYIHLDSNLDGMAIDLPAPLAKTATERVSLGIDFRFPEPETSVWTMTLADRLSAKARFDLGGEAMRFLGATVQTGSQDVPAPTRAGLVIGGYTQALSVDDWLEVDFGEGEGEGLGPEQVLTEIDLFVTDLRVMEQHVSDASAKLVQDDGVWRARIDSASMTGTVTIPFDLYGPDPVIVDMDRLAIDDEESDGGGGTLDPKLIPAASISIVDFSLESTRLGSLDGSIERIPGGFSTDGLTMRGEGFGLVLAGSSVLSAEQDRSQFTLSFESGNVGRALEFMGFTSGIDAEKGVFDADLSWSGGLPPSILAVAEGTAKISLEQGSLTEVEPGTGRVFGLLSVQALPRRLVLDFRDIYQKGFFFEKFRGDFRIGEGQAFSDNLIMKGRSADIGIVGTVDLIDRSYDQIAVVSAEVGNTLPVVGAIAAGPAIGAGLFVLKELFKDSLSGIVGAQYRITGPWEDPVVEPISVADAEAAGQGRPGPVSEQEE
ncbi:MAG: YhdP family protein [Gammaproteobacteria bacterium]